MMVYRKNAYCSYCGAAFEPDQPWPRRCGVCKQLTFQNPIPVAVVLVPVDDGVLVVQRSIAPQCGAWAFPGGYIDWGESWQEAGAREVYEEARVKIAPDRIQVMTVFSPPDGGTVIIAGQAAALQSRELVPFTPTAETSGRRIATAPEPLAWPLHTELLAAYLTKRTV